MNYANINTTCYLCSNYICNCVELTYEKLGDHLASSLYLFSILTCIIKYATATASILGFSHSTYIHTI